VNPGQLIAALHSQAGRNTIFDLRLRSGETSPAMVVETQFEPVRGQLLHLDLKRIAMDRKLKVSVPIITSGEAKGVKTQGGILEVVLRSVEVECLPTDIPDNITVAVDELMIGDAVRAADLQKGLGEKAVLVEDPNAVICHVVQPKMEEEVKPAAEAAAEGPAEPELIKKGKAAEEGEEEQAEAAEKSEKPEKREKREKEK
jgi:large subunit ribosomal protein L25